MSEDKPKEKLGSPKEQEKLGLNAPDSNVSRVAGTQELLAVEKTRTNASDGSLRKFADSRLDDQEQSIEIFYGEHVASRKLHSTESDLENLVSHNDSASAKLSAGTVANKSQDRATIEAGLTSEIKVESTEHVVCQLHFDYASEVAPYRLRPSPDSVNSYTRDADDAVKKTEIDRQSIAQDNWQFLGQFIAGAGKDLQEHTDRKNDAILIEFISSPGAQKIREQYASLGNPAITDKLGYGTWEAYEQTVKKPFLDALQQGLSGKDFGKILLDREHWGSIGTQVGGFGMPPKEEAQWASAMGRRCNFQSSPDPNGDYVQFRVVNLAGMNSFGIHLAPNNPFGEQGPMRTIVQVFEWTEPLREKDQAK